MIDPNQQIDDAIYALHLEGKSYRYIQMTLRVGQHRISDVIHRRTMNHKRGRKPKISQEILEFVDMNTLANAKISNAQMQGMIKEKYSMDLSLKSIANSRKQLGFVYRPPMKIQKLSDEQKTLRIQFAKYAQKELVDKTIVFSDESRFGILPDNNWVYIKKGNWNETALTCNEKFIDSVMFWGAIGLDYKSPLILCSNGMDGNEYISIINNSKMTETCDMKHGRYKCFFMQDGAPCHNAQIVSNFFYSKCKLIPGWPPNSPDLNPIEMVWAIIKKRLKKIQIRSKDELIEQVYEVWNSLDQSMINNLIRDFNRRIDLVAGVNDARLASFCHRTACSRSTFKKE